MSVDDTKRYIQLRAEHPRWSEQRIHKAMQPEPEPVPVPAREWALVVVCVAVAIVFGVLGAVLV